MMQRGSYILQWGSMIIGALYVNGFYINSIFTANYGILRTELLRLDYIKTGFIFSLITLGIVFIPLGILYLTWIVRRSSGLPNLYIGLIGNSSNTLLFFSLPLFLACFATSHEWYSPLHDPFLFVRTVEAAVILFLCLTAFGMAVVPAIERILVGRFRVLGPRFSAIVEPLRFIPIVFSFVILEKIFRSVEWSPSLLRSGIYFFLVAIVFVFGIIAAGLWLKNVGKTPWSALLICSLVGVGLAVLYYMAVTSYVFGVYKFIPKNRGGALPVTEIFLGVEDEKLLPTGAKRLSAGSGFGPYYLIEENDGFLFLGFEKVENWLTDFIPIYVISKDKVSTMYIHRIEDGFPRSNLERTKGTAPK